MTSFATPPETIFDFYFKAGYYCNLCGAFRDRKEDMRKHVKGFHGSKIKEELTAAVDGTKV